MIFIDIHWYTLSEAEADTKQCLDLPITVGIKLCEAVSERLLLADHEKAGGWNNLISNWGIDQWSLDHHSNDELENKKICWPITIESSVWWWLKHVKTCYPFVYFVYHPQYLSCSDISSPIFPRDQTATMDIQQAEIHPATLSTRRCDEMELYLCFHWQRATLKRNWCFGFEWLWLNVSVCQVLRFWKKCLFMILNLKYACDAVKVDCFQSQLTLWLQTCDMGQRCLMCLKSILETGHCRISTISSISDVIEYS